MAKISATSVILLLVSGALANISFPKPYINCKETADKCLRGQFCGSDNLCKFRSQAAGINIRSPAPAPGDLSTTGRCGPDSGGLVCDPNSTVYQGSCCSAYGWCGASPAHCGEGCSSGPCTGTGGTTTPPTPPVEPSGEPVISVSTSAATATGVPTTSGSCGTQNGGTTCAGWSMGGCCSMYGWCGDTSAHCGDGCQSGPCVTPPNVPGPAPAPITNGGAFTIIGQSGVPAMHAGLLPNGRVFFLDKVEDYTQLRLPNGRFAYSSEYNPATNQVVPLAYTTNAFCSGGTYLANGDVIALGGNGPLDWLDPTVGDGFDGIRYLTRSATNAALNGQSWREPGNKLASKRWYPSVQTLADGRIFVASGSLNGLDPTVPANNNPTYEILSATGISSGVNVPLEILVKNQPYYMYPFMHLLKDGNIFIFTAKSSQIFNINTNTVVKELPDLIGDYRTYPNTGGSVLLPISSASNWVSRVMVCGGGAYQDVTSPTEATCGVISPESANAAWDIDSMPEGRGMVEGTLLPDGTVLWVNGANRGAQGFELATDPTLRALLYDPTKAKGTRWTQLAASTIPRLYHSVALLLLDGTLLIAGSNPHEMPILTQETGKPFITDFRVERFTPPYLQGGKAALRPTNLVVPATIAANNALLTIRFTVPVTAKAVKVSLYQGGFVTHSVHMNHRMLFLNRTGFVPGVAAQTLTIRAPPNNNVAPPGDYVIYVVADGIPSVGKVVRITT